MLWQVVTGFHLGQWKASMPRERFQELIDEVMGLIVSGKVVPFSGKSFPLEKAAEAVQEANKQARGGKVFLKG